MKHKALLAPYWLNVEGLANGSMITGTRANLPKKGQHTPAKTSFGQNHTELRLHETL